jgi:single-strand DNA-binding protein
MRYMPNGKAVTNFSVACGRSWRDAGSGDQREETEWFSVVCYEKLAEITNQYLSKGKQVFLEGRLQTRSWSDQEGVKHYKTEMIAHQMLMLGAREGAGRADGGNGGERDGQPAAAGAAVPFDDDLPF